MKGFHECEMKFYITCVEKEKEFVNILLNQEYRHNQDRLETDYIFDTLSLDLKKNKVLFRVRVLKYMDKQEILFTIKLKGKSSKFQDSIEFETTSSDNNKDMVTKILDILREYTGITVSISIFRMHKLEDIIKSLQDSGFSPENIMQKYRTEYISNRAKILIDKFPKIEGFFIEIEANSEQILFETIKDLSLDMDLADKRNYGQIMSELSNDSKILLFDN